MNLQERIETISEMGRTRTIVEINTLISEIVSNISHHTALPEDELLKWIEDGEK